jgi:hypothetical protein
MGASSPETVLLFARRVRPPDGPPLDDAGVAVRAGRVAAVSGRAELEARFPGVSRHELEGAVLMPGFHDAHLHLTELVRQALAVDLSGVRDLPGLEARLRQAPPSAWVLGLELDLQRFEGFGGPARDFLDRVVPGRPCALCSTDLHSLFANRLALAAAGLPADGPGILQEEDAQPLRRVLPLPEGETFDAALRRTARALRAQGITRVTDFSGLALDKRLWNDPAPDRFPLKVTTSLYAHELGEPRATDFRSGQRRGRVTRGHLKLFADGSLGSDTAWMLAPGGRGRPGYPDAELGALVAQARGRGLGVALHAIGDAAVRQAASVLGPGDRIEHGQHVDPADLPALAACRATVCVNPAHLALDWQTCLARLPRGGAGAYAFASLRAAGVPLVIGSDAPVVPARPWAAIRWAVQRHALDGLPAGGFLPAERLPLEVALGLHQDAASRLRPGDPADLVALDRDPFEAGPGALEQVRTLACFLDGQPLD